ncbi:hypothetical protein IHE45_16G062100 [Dioscorea alata]|uniref:Uncharacterized protein n=1 Tax=Dioscorea alata TaxID=55571 RepID=A0ACB7UHT4_DIOAL|nr:hypothetical protein IHE45_16G062100 [Dioscorea alata]
MKMWSLKLNELVDIMNTNRFGCDDARKCVIIDNGQKHPKMGNHANKEFKELKRLQGIFGKSSANGQGAEIAADIVEGLNDDTNNVVENDLELDEEHILMFIESMNNYMFAVTYCEKMPCPPMARKLGEEVKKLGLSEDEEVYLLIKFSHNHEHK